ncbi:hypothetical protein HanXRQr2_Chr04g0184441 [Helianthus annuus]|uniref:Uncharacterized protein n=1 Tax=Helianthus annuus TaxID=4232 RepID=A0A9K3NTT0_HELAN|nr:hypothetical protein HanXRQr2_Chr04g0184441 [Helianthus annuus]
MVIECQLNALFITTALSFPDPPPYYSAIGRLCWWRRFVLGDNVVLDERWLGFRWLQMKLAVMVRH